MKDVIVWIVAVGLIVLTVAAGACSEDAKPPVHPHGYRIAGLVIGIIALLLVGLA